MIKCKFFIPYNTSQEGYFMEWVLPNYEVHSSNLDYSINGIVVNMNGTPFVVPMRNITFDMSQTQDAKMRFKNLFDEELEKPKNSQ